MAVSLRLPDDVKVRIARLADAGNTTTHAFMLDAIREKVEIEEARVAFHLEAKRRLARMKKTGNAISASEVFDYLLGRAQGRRVRRPKARKSA